jgi:hypothetical protein
VSFQSEIEKIHSGIILFETNDFCCAAAPVADVTAESDSSWTTSPLMETNAIQSNNNNTTQRN